MAKFFEPVRSFLSSRLESFRFNSLKFEISFIYSMMLLLILLVFSLVVYLILSYTLYTELDIEARFKAIEVSENIRLYLKHKPDALNFALEKTIGNEDKILRRWWLTGFERRWFQRLDEQDLSRDYVNFISPQGKSLMHSKNIDKTLLRLFLNNASLPNGQELFFDIKNGSQKLRVINYPFVVQNEEHYILQVGISPNPVIQLLQNWMKKMILSIPLIIALTSFLGYFLALRILRPVERISALAQSITLKDLSQRVETKYPYHEMNALVDSFNNMISRLEKSFNHIQNFSSYLAHELKTPLTIIRGELELALMKSSGIPERRETLRICLEETEKVLKIIDDLLLITRMDHNPSSFKFVELNFGEYLTEIYDQAVMLAGKKNIHVVLILPKGENILVQADPLHLRRLFFNLIDNALKFVPVGGHVEIMVESEEDQVVTIISDNGPGISPENLDKIFERFYTTDTRNFGSGLGLSIAQSIAKAHRGKIEVRSRLQEGSVFTVILPALSSSV